MIDIPVAHVEREEAVEGELYSSEFICNVGLSGVQEGAKISQRNMPSYLVLIIGASSLTAL